MFGIAIFGTSGNFLPAEKGRVENITFHRQSVTRGSKNSAFLGSFYVFNMLGVVGMYRSDVVFVCAEKCIENKNDTDLFPVILFVSPFLSSFYVSSSLSRHRGIFCTSSVRPPDITLPRKRE